MDSVPNHLGLLLRGHVGVRKVEIVRVNHGAQRNAETHETRVAGLLLNDGVVEGPTCFGGCMDLCVNTNFFVSKQKGKAGDIAIIQKKARDPGFMGFCIALCTVVDTYNLDFTDPNMTPQQKAQVIGDAVHLDYLFFDQEQPLCRYNESNDTIEILLCLCYCFGCLCPIKLCIPTKQN
jgi:hypothetical protein